MFFSFWRIKVIYTLVILKIGTYGTGREGKLTNKQNNQISYRASKSLYHRYWGTFTKSSRLRNISNKSSRALSPFKIKIDRTLWIVTYQILSFKIFISSPVSPQYTSIFHFGTLISSIFLNSEPNILNFLSPAKIGWC